MATYRYVCYDLLETFKQTFDDKEISITQVLFWVQIIENRLKSQHIKKNFKNNSTTKTL